jgi:exodeoxyribonuclease VII large subunit
MRIAASDRVSRGRQSVAVSSDVLAALDPAAVLRRGYAALQRSADGLPVFSVAQAEPGTRILALLGDGTLESSVDVALPRSPDATLSR